MLPNPLAVNTWIRFKHAENWYHDYRRHDTVLFMGWINNPIGGHNALIMDDRGIRTLELTEEEWEIYDVKKT